MRRRSTPAKLFVVVALAVSASAVLAEVVRIEVQSRSDCFGGAAIRRGRYEKLAGVSSPSIPRSRRTASSPTSTRRRATPPARSSSRPTSS